MARDPYQVLQLPPGAPLAEVKRAYRRLAKANHPDSAGPGALTRFLEIQHAYEQLTAGRQWRPGMRRPAPSTSPAPGEPWRAETGRARGTPGADGSARRSTRGGTDGPGRSRSRAAGSASPAGGTGSGEPKSRRRRGTKKATFGSTSYDEAREAADTSWSGAAWYGPSSGEYWHVNPREYADPRKHGPEYQARARARAEAAAERRARAARAAAGAGTPDDAEPQPSDRAWPPDQREHREGPTARDAREAWAAREAAGSPGPSRAWAAARAERPGSASAAPPPARPASWSLPDLDLSEPARHLLRALIAWPPLGIAAAALIGEATGCAGFEASCAPPADLFPWLAQALILAALISIPPLARILAGGTVAVVLLAFPVTAVLSAGGAQYDRTYGPAALIGVLAVAWAAGVAAMLLRGTLARSTP